MRFVLASASPARLTTLRAAGVEPEVIVSGVDEDAISAPSGPELVQALASAKARAVAARLDGDLLLLGCDSMLEIGDQVLGKPESVEEAVARWQLMRGQTGVLHTGHTLLSLAGGAVARSVEGVASTEVRFADLSDDEIAAYVDTGEPLKVAGAFSIDGLGGWFVESIAGDHHNVVGLSLPLLRGMLAELGHRVTDLPSTIG
ncbi:MAG TPA: Maf family protein [Jatrophihabitans sp.]|nr:Maf family protein [Jatrophihabitans sp.]